MPSRYDFPVREGTRHPPTGAVMTNGITDPAEQWSDLLASLTGQRREAVVAALRSSAQQGWPADREAVRLLVAYANGQDRRAGLCRRHRDLARRARGSRAAPNPAAPGRAAVVSACNGAAVVSASAGIAMVIGSADTDTGTRATGRVDRARADDHPRRSRRGLRLRPHPGRGVPADHTRRLRLTRTAIAGPRTRVRDSSSSPSRRRDRSSRARALRAGRRSTPAAGGRAFARTP